MAPSVYTGIVGCFTQTLKQEGPIGLYRGIGPTLAGIIPYTGIQ